MFLDHFIIAILALLGLIVSLTIYYKKKKEHFSCFLNMKCDRVIHSPYNKLFGVSLEYWGILYYSFICLLNVYFLIPTLPIPDFLVFISTVASGFAVLFSLYLLFVQAYIIKQFCSYCLLSGVISILMFILILLDLSLELIPILVHLKPLVVMLHLFALVLGLGGATYSDIFFMRFLNNFKIDKHEAGVLRIISEVIWVGIAFFILSGIALFLIDAERLLESTKFLAKMVIFGVIVLNGIAMHVFVIPKLVEISFLDKLRHRSPSFRLRTAAFIMGGISLTSWYSAFILGGLPSVPLSTPQILGIYLAFLFIAATGALIFEQYFLRRSRNDFKI